MSPTSEATPSVEFPVWAGTGVVAVADPASLAAARAATDEVIAQFDLACSRFREDSELSAVTAAGGSAVQVSELFLDAVSAALRAASLTEGDVDPTVGESLMALGYDRDFGELGTRRMYSIARVPGWRSVELDPERSTVRVKRGVRLDLGATAKALAADRAAERAVATAGCGVLISLGGDLAIRGDAPDGGWRVRVTDDHRAGFDAPGQWITLESGGLATSSTTVRSWRAGTEELHHLIDPASGRPVDGIWRTATVAAASCLDANIASTAAIVRGERAVPWLESLGLPSRLVSVEGKACHLAGWPVEDDDLAGLTEAV